MIPHPSSLIPPPSGQAPLDLGDEPVSLRLIFERSDLARRPQWTFERAMKCPSVRKCIENTARAVAKARARTQRRLQHSTD